MAGQRGDRGNVSSIILNHFGQKRFCRLQHWNTGISIHSILATKWFFIFMDLPKSVPWHSHWTTARSGGQVCPKGAGQIQRPHCWSAEWPAMYTKICQILVGKGMQLCGDMQVMSFRSNGIGNKKNKNCSN